jgi:hypothetical protein
MIITLSPAKSLDFSPSNIKTYSSPRLLEHSERLVDALKKKTPKKLQDLMSISLDLAELNVERYNTFHTPFTLENAKQALLAFSGDVYLGLEAATMTEDEVKLANQKIRILSGLYGLLRPLDLIQPYRLEMGTKLKTRRGPNLYKFWGDRITGLLNKDILESQSMHVLNLASNEYWKSVNRKKLAVPVIDADFLENRNGTYRFISFTGKKARGHMARFIIENKISQPSDLRAFDYDGYIYHEEMSTEQKFVFTKG